MKIRIHHPHPAAEFVPASTSSSEHEAPMVSFHDPEHGVETHDHASPSSASPAASAPVDHHGVELEATFHD